MIFYHILSTPGWLYVDRSSGVPYVRGDLERHSFAVAAAEALGRGSSSGAPAGGPNMVYNI